MTESLAVALLKQVPLEAVSWTVGCVHKTAVSHSQATLEGNFSVNREVGSDNMHGDSVVTCWIVVCDHIVQAGGVTQVRPLAGLWNMLLNSYVDDVTDSDSLFFKRKPKPKRLLVSLAAARTRHRVHLDLER